MREVHWAIRRVKGRVSNVALSRQGKSWPALRLGGLDLKSQPEESISAADCVVIVTDHSAFDYRRMVEQAALIVDTRSALKGVDSSKIVRL